MKNSPFFKQAEIMLRVMPFVAREKCFALKGGTAINFFIRDLPRLSVDIDLTYLPIEPRDQSLQGIAKALKNITLSIQQALPNFKIKEQVNSKTKLLSKLLITADGQLIKIEPNEVLRGSVLPPLHVN